MTRIGPFIIMKAAQYPLFEKVDRMSRDLTLNEIDEILAGKRHTHKNPGKRKAPVPYPGEEGIYPKAGE